MVSLSNHDIRPSTGSGRTESTLITIQPGPLKAREITIPGDISSAAFFLAAAAILPDSSVTVKGVGLNPTRTGILEVLKRMGGRVVVRPSTGSGRTGVEEWEPVGDVTVSSSSLSGTTVESQETPRLIDELPILMVAATQARGTTVIRQAGELRVKETDRIRSMVTGLTALGAKIRSEGDSIVIDGAVRLKGGALDSFGDHRTAMALAVAALCAQGATTLEGSEWVAISYPGFFEQLKGVLTFEGQKG